MEDRCESCARPLRVGEGKVCRRCEAYIRMALRVAINQLQQEQNAREAARAAVRESEVA